ncbi:MAG TPA: helix-turn-helix transcriptional regulator [Solirubrobacterales bacterium]|nr:helix-turn-helix transcriptional regulator [Solirubrobacterales bacterium]
MASRSRDYREAAAKRIGENLRLQRRGLLMSQEALAFRAGLHRTEVGMLEHGARLPRIDTMVKLATSLEAPIGDLVEGLAWVPAHELPGGQFIAPRRGLGG